MRHLSLRSLSKTRLVLPASLVPLLLGFLFASCETPSEPGPSSCREDAVPHKAETPSCSPSDSLSSALKWAPPSWSQTIVVSKSGNQSIGPLDNHVDYRIVMPDWAMPSSLEIVGGRNITLIGGAFHLQPGGGTASLAITDSSNTEPRIVHIEGVSFDMSDAVSGTFGPHSNGDADGIVLLAPTAIVRLQNVRITGVHGNSEWHGDALENYEGAKEVHFFRTTIETDYQGLVLPAVNVYNDSVIEQVTITKTDFSGRASYSEQGLVCPLYLLLVDAMDGCGTYPGGGSLFEVYVTHAEGCYGFGTDVHPSTGGPAACAAQIAPSGAQLSWPTWPASNGLRGQVTLGAPPGGPFVPPGAAGIRYQSPGYGFVEQ